MKTVTERTLRVDNVSLGYGAQPIVKDLSLEFPQGKVTAIIGPNDAVNPRFCGVFRDSCIPLTASFCSMVSLRISTP